MPWPMICYRWRPSDRNEVEKRSRNDNWNWLSELKQRQNVQPVELDRFRQLLRQEFGQGGSRKSALHALIERITAYLDRSS